MSKAVAIAIVGGMTSLGLAENVVIPTEWIIPVTPKVQCQQQERKDGQVDLGEN